MTTKPRGWWRVWYTNGAFDYGWLASEGGNGTNRIYEAFEEEAKRQAELENQVAPYVLHQAFPANMNDVELEIECEKMRLEARRRQRARWA